MKGLLFAVKNTPDAPFLGTRDRSSSSGYTYQSYADALSQVAQLAAGLRSVCGLRAGENVGLLALNRAEYLLTEYALYRHSCVPVSLYEALGPNAIQYIAAHAGLRVLFTTKAKMKAVLEALPQLPLVEHVVMFENEPSALPAPQSVPGNAKFHTFAALLDAGAAQPIDAEPPSADDVALIMYTSGTTGTPVMRKKWECSFAFCEFIFTFFPFSL